MPSITGRAASGPMSPRPSTAVPSVTIATVLLLLVSDQTLSGSSAIARQARATPGVYAIERSSGVLSGTLDAISSLPPRWSSSVRSATCSTSMPSCALTASVMRAMCSSSTARIVTSRTFLPCSSRTRSIASSRPPASPIAAAIRANAPGRLSRCTRSVALNAAEVCGVITLRSCREAAAAASARLPGGSAGKPQAEIGVCREGIGAAVLYLRAIARQKESSR